MAVTEETNEILARLDTLIKLQAWNIVRNLDSQKEKILFLARVGMRPKEIGEILGTSANSVSVALAKAKAAGKKADAGQKLVVEDV